VLLDSNIIIYAAEEGRERLQDWLEARAISASVICRIEVLGYAGLDETKKHWFADFFHKIPVHELTHNVVDAAIRLRQQKRMGIADAIIAATALVRGLKLVTHNVEDFKHIKGLEIVDPLEM
jgi:predicted nucleic acid-binding protein